MNRSARIVLLAAVFVATLPLAAADARADIGRFIVVLEDSANNPSAIATEHANENSGTVGHVYSSALNGYSITMPADRVANLEGDPRVAYVARDLEGNFLVAKGGNPGKPGSGTTQPAQTLPTGIRRTFAHLSPAAAIGTGRMADVDLAVLDTGVDASHPDLNVVGGYWCGGLSSSGYGTDSDGHGTHVAGTVAARDNSIGVVGMAPGARIYSLRIPDKRGSWSVSSAVCAVDWITAQRNADGSARIEAANMSFRWDHRFSNFPGQDDGNCGLTNGDPFHQAICRSVEQGTTYIAAAGNEAWDAKQAVPAGYDEVITVSALADSDGAPGGTWSSACSDQEDTFANFSNYGLDVDIIAPGVCINSTTPGGKYGLKSGTSMAAPHVTGAAGLYKMVNPTASPSQVQAGLTGSGNFNWVWTLAEDKDGLQEPLLDVSSFGVTAP